MQIQRIKIPVKLQAYTKSIEKRRLIKPMDIKSVQSVYVEQI